MWAVKAALDGRYFKQRVLYNMAGTAAAWDTPMDPTAIVASAVDGQFWRRQGVGYSAGTFPMGKSVNEGLVEHLRLLDLKDPEEEWGGVYYSQSGIVARKLYKLTRPGQPYERHGKTLKIMVIFGPPCRELNVANGNKYAGLPMPADNTRGISDDCWNASDPTPDWVYDFVHRGDIYGEVANNDVGEDMTMIFKIVQDPLAGFGLTTSALTGLSNMVKPGSKTNLIDFGTVGNLLTNTLSGKGFDIKSIFGLGKTSGGIDLGENTAIEQITELLTSPLREVPAAVVAIFNGLRFVIGQPWPTYPHTSYPGADTDAAIRLLTEFGANVPVGV